MAESTPTSNNARKFRIEREQSGSVPSTPATPTSRIDYARTPSSGTLGIRDAYDSSYSPDASSPATPSSPSAAVRRMPSPPLDKHHFGRVDLGTPPPYSGRSHSSAPGFETLPISFLEGISGSEGASSCVVVPRDPAANPLTRYAEIAPGFWHELALRARTAEETWDPFLLQCYLAGIFIRVVEQGRVAYGYDAEMRLAFALFNSGLVDDYYKEIYVVLRERAPGAAAPGGQGPLQEEGAPGPFVADEASVLVGRDAEPFARLLPGRVLPERATFCEAGDARLAFNWEAAGQSVFRSADFEGLVEARFDLLVRAGVVPAAAARREEAGRAPGAREPFLHTPPASPRSADASSSRAQPRPAPPRAGRRPTPAGARRHGTSLKGALREAIERCRLNFNLAVPHFVYEAVRLVSPTQQEVTVHVGALRALLPLHFDDAARPQLAASLRALDGAYFLEDLVGLPLAFASARLLAPVAAPWLRPAEAARAPAPEEAAELFRVPCAPPPRLAPRRLPRPRLPHRPRRPRRPLPPPLLQPAARLAAAGAGVGEDAVEAGPGRSGPSPRAPASAAPSASAMPPATPAAAQPAPARAPLRGRGPSPPPAAPPPLPPAPPQHLPPPPPAQQQQQGMGVHLPAGHSPAPHGMLALRGMHEAPLLPPGAPPFEFAFAAVPAYGPPLGHPLYHSAPLQPPMAMALAPVGPAPSILPPRPPTALDGPIPSALPGPRDSPQSILPIGVGGKVFIA
eukprot:tig00001636_g9529.t1